MTVVAAATTTVLLDRLWTLMALAITHFLHYMYGLHKPQHFLLRLYQSIIIDRLWSAETDSRHASLCPTAGAAVAASIAGAVTARLRERDIKYSNCMSVAQCRL